MKIHCVAMVCVVIAGFVFHITPVEWCICLTLFGLVMALEMVNTAVEAVVDLVTKERRPLAKLAKDAAVFCELCAGAGGCFAFRPAPASGLGALGCIRPGTGAGAVNVGNSAQNTHGLAQASPRPMSRRRPVRYQAGAAGALRQDLGHKCCQKRFTAAYCRLQTGHIAASGAVYLSLIWSVETSRPHPVAGAQRFLSTPAPCGLLRYE